VMHLEVLVSSLFLVGVWWWLFPLLLQWRRFNGVITGLVQILRILISLLRLAYPFRQIISRK